MERRRLEREAKIDAIAVCRWCRLRGLTWTRIGRLLRVAVSSLRRWLRGWREDRLKLEPRGRPVQRACTRTRNQVLAVMGIVGPGIEVAVLRRLFPTLARRELEDLVARYRRVLRKRGTLLHQLEWTNDGAVWAIDFTEAPTPVDGVYRNVLVVRDLGSGAQLLALPAEDATAATVCDALGALFAEHGPPLVLKSDNAGCFTGHATTALLEDHEVIALVSPPGTPRYNGACEAGIGGIKTRAHLLAARDGDPGHWTCNHVEAARLMANETHRPDGPHALTAGELWARRQPEGERKRLHETVETRTKEEREHFVDVHGRAPSRREKAAIRRIAVCRALVDCGHLQLRRRRFSLRI